MTTYPYPFLPARPPIDDDTGEPVFDDEDTALADHAWERVSLFADSGRDEE